MTNIQAKQIEKALESMLHNIRMKKNISKNLIEIEQLRQTVQATAPRQLNHFLERRSYTKALDYLLSSEVVPKSPNQPPCTSDQA